MGINVNLDVADLPQTITPATSLMAELGRPVDRLALLWGVLRQIEHRYLALQRSIATGQPGDVHREWASHLVTLGQQVNVTSGESALAGTADGVDENGSLLLRAADGGLHRITVGDVTLRGPAGA
jgi:BirA family biotin operon repressor/biotin-[acetyl-CoA-carboxylase] ligase